MRSNYVTEKYIKSCVLRLSNKMYKVAKQMESKSLIQILTDDSLLTCSHITRSFERGFDTGMPRWLMERRELHSGQGFFPSYRYQVNKYYISLGTLSRKWHRQVTVLAL